MAGIKDTKEVLVLIEVFGVFLARTLKDGFQFTDVQELFDKMKDDPEFVKAFMDAFNGIQNIPGEVIDIDVFEGISLGRQGIGMVGSFIDALK